MQMYGDKHEFETRRPTPSSFEVEIVIPHTTSKSVTEDSEETQLTSEGAARPIREQVSS
jgi:hypothetical protein